MIYFFSVLEYYPEDGFRMKMFYELLVRLIATGMFPLSMVQQPAFVALVTFLDPKIKMPSTTKFTDTILPEFYNKARTRLIGELNEAEAVAVTTDMWTSRKMDSFMAVTVHFVSPGADLCNCFTLHLTSIFLKIGFKLISRVLSTVQLEESHTAEYLLATLKGVLTEFKINFNK